MTMMRKTIDSEGQHLLLLLLPPPLETAAVGFKYISSPLASLVAFLLISSGEQDDFDL